jgi:hypothetical protein
VCVVESFKLQLSEAKEVALLSFVVLYTIQVHERVIMHYCCFVPPPPPSTC